MIKEVKRKKMVKKTPASQKAWRWSLAILLVGLLPVASFIYLQKIKNVPLDTSALKASFNRLSSWVTDHRSRLNQKIVKVQQIAANHSEEPVHFEFYSELPKMTMPVPKTEEKSQ